MPVELAALIVAVLWAVIAAVLAKRGRKELKEANPQLPQTQQTLRRTSNGPKHRRADPHAGDIDPTRANLSRTSTS